MGKMKLILGGIALAATGYGLKKYLEAKQECASWTNKPGDIIAHSLSNFFEGLGDKLGAFEDKANSLFDKVDTALYGENAGYTDEQRQKLTKEAMQIASNAGLLPQISKDEQEELLQSKEFKDLSPENQSALKKLFEFIVKP